ncbi:MAG: hypothetical protein AAF416_05965 [Pseudomonadota bacterium]
MSDARNRPDRSRVVLANTYYADGTRIVNSPTMVSGNWQKFCLAWASRHREVRAEPGLLARIHGWLMY